MTALLPGRRSQGDSFTGGGIRRRKRGAGVTREAGGTPFGIIGVNAGVPEPADGRYSAAIMVSSPRFRPPSVPRWARDSVLWVRDLVGRQFVTGNRRGAAGLAA